ncbi:MAG: DNA primase [Lachnospiraceae bacterium]|nr:DNA primase [Lachnospiraceae bacterium]
MPYYDSEIIEEVRSRSDIVSVISKYVNLKKSGSSYTGLCPFHNEKTPSFHVTPSKQIYHCFGCGAGGDVFNFICNYENVSFNEALSMLAADCGVSLPERHMGEEEKRARSRREQILAANKDAAYYYYSVLRSPKGKDAMEYFNDRGLSETTIKNFGLGYSEFGGLYAFLRKKGYNDDILKDTGLIKYSETEGAKDKFWNRVMFPIMDASSRVIAFGGRLMGDGKPKYLNSPETPVFHKSSTLYALNIAKRSRREGFILCEGYMDVISLHQAGFDNALASLGTALTEQHAGILSRYSNVIYLSYDSDGAGTKAAVRAAEIFKRIGIMPRVVDLSPYKDPDELIKTEGADEYENRLKNAKNAFLFTIEVLLRDYDMSDPGQKTLFQNEIAIRLSDFSNEMERNNYLEAVCREYSIDPKTMIRAVAKIAAEESLKSPSERKRAIPEDPTEPRSKKKESVKRDEGIVRLQMLLLKWMTDEPALYKKVKKFITTEDFDEGIIKSAAEVIYKSLEEGREPDIGVLLSEYKEDEDQRALSRLFFENVDGMDDPLKRSKALSEAVLRIKKHGLDKNAGKDGENALKSRIEGRKILAEIEKTAF